MKYYERKNCRLCGSTKFQKGIELNPTPWCDDYVTKDNLDKIQNTYPVTVQICTSCRHGQLTHVLDAEDIYLHYTYETSSSVGLRKHFAKSAKKIIEKFNPNRTGYVLDIGSNDGILLSFFKKMGMKVLGIDPMPGIDQKAALIGVPTLSKFFDTKTTNEINKEHGKPSIITCNNLFANTDNLDLFVKNVKSLMDKNSIFSFETFYFYLQIKNFVWDFIYHEHISYFTVTPLMKFFKKFEMEIIDVSANLSKGGSMMCTVQLIGGKQKINPSVNKFLELENDFDLQYSKVYDNYSKKIQESKKIFKEKIYSLKKQGKKIAGYGASASSTTLIYHYEMGDILECIYDDYEVKQGLYSPGFHIPVFNSKDIYKQQPDYIVILAWRFFDKIIAKHKSFIENGGKFILPLPAFKII